MLKAVPVGQEPEGVKVSPDGKRVYVTSEVANMVHVIDAASAQGAEEHRGRQAAAPLRVQHRRQRAVGHQRAGRERQHHLDGRSARHRQKSSSRSRACGADDITPVGIVLGRDGKTMFVGLGRANHVAFVDVATRKVGALVLVGKRAWNVALEQATARGCSSSTACRDDMTVVDVAGAKAIKTIPVGRVPYGVVLDE